MELQHVYRVPEGAHEPTVKPTVVLVRRLVNQIEVATHEPRPSTGRTYVPELLQEGSLFGRRIRARTKDVRQPPQLLRRKRTDRNGNRETPSI